MTNMYLQANINLNKKIDELKNKIRELSWFEREYPHLKLRCQRAEKQLEVKRKTVKVNGIYPSDRTILYSLMTTMVEDTPDGLFIVVELPGDTEEKLR